jgi:2,3-bisphosphoglycerate-independent phosphoglycerate mutase
MKYILIVPDGMADDPLADLGGRTPMEVARKPYMDELAKKGTVGVVNVTPPGMYPGSDAANMSLLGYDPLEYYTGRGPIEAAAMDISLDTRDVAFRCSLISTDGEKLIDYSAGHVTTDEARPLIELAAQKLATRQMHFFPGVSYRHIMVWNDGPLNVQTHAPHENMGRSLDEILPVGDGESQLRKLIWDSLELFDSLPFNKRRREEGKLPANTLWPWGQGRAPQLPSFFQRRSLTGAVVSAVDVIRGLGRLTGLEIVNVPGATGYFDTDYYAKGRAAVDALGRHDFVWVHVESPDEAGHAGSIDEKIKAIECIDQLVVGTMLDGLKKLDDFRMLVVPDHATPIETRGHKAMPVPFLLFDSRKEKGNKVPYDERAVHERVTHVEEGYKLIDQLLQQPR